MKTFQIYLLRGGEILSNIDVKQYEFNELSRKSDIKSAIESMLFVSGEPLPLREISNNLELKEKMWWKYFKKWLLNMKIKVEE